MIKSADAIAYARSLIGTPYGSGKGEIDCINLIKKIIRNCAGGKSDYTTATTVSLWRSYTMSAKYKDLTDRGEGVSKDVPAGRILFKGKPTSEHQPHHVGIATGEGTVIHASSAKGAVVETEINDQWTLWGDHRYIEVASTSHETPILEEQEHTDFPAQGTVVTSGGSLNLRKYPNTNKGTVVLQKIPCGTELTLTELNNGWYHTEYNGDAGWVSADYIDISKPPFERVLVATINDEVFYNEIVPMLTEHGTDFYIQNGDD